MSAGERRANQIEVPAAREPHGEKPHRRKHGDDRTEDAWCGEALRREAEQERGGSGLREARNEPVDDRFSALSRDGGQREIEELRARSIERVAETAIERFCDDGAGHGPTDGEC